MFISLIKPLKKHKENFWSSFFKKSSNTYCNIHLPTVMYFQEHLTEESDINALGSHFSVKSN